ncbi:hypothetical protein PG993_001977 [Apiospora rasikravindrae]|uniref:DUF7905 domain-containing protein n=1 Tax=Apiospora rasikravindrae TaxID=990691 RepID=A0ABR1UFA6_9PEZI
MDDLIDFEQSPRKGITGSSSGVPLVAQLSILDEPCPENVLGLTIEASHNLIENEPPTENDTKAGGVAPAAEHLRDTYDSIVRIQPPSPGPSADVAPGVPEPLLLQTRPARRPAPSQRPCRRPVGDIWGTWTQKQWAIARTDRRQQDGDSELSEITESRYLISHNPELSKGVLEGVCKELGYTDSEVRIFGNNHVQFLQIQSSSPDINIQRLDMARTLTDEFISDKTVTTRATFVEPSGSPLAGFEVFMDPETHESKGLGVRPVVRPCGDSMDSQPKDRTDDNPLYFGNFCQQLSAVLKRVGRLNSGYNLKVVFGRYVVTTYPKKRDKYDLEGFRKLMGQSRCQGKLVSQLGVLNDAIRILNALKREDGVFQPPGVNTRSLDDIKPTFAFEVYSAQHRFTAQLVREGDETAFSMKKLQCYPLQDEDSAEFCYNTLCLGRNFDWKIQLMNEVPESDESYQTLKSYLATAQITLPSTTSDPNPDMATFPHVKLCLQGNMQGKALISNIQKTAIRSVYSFRYGLTDYILDFVIRREWESVRDMTLRHQPSSMTYSIILRGEHWGDYKGNRATDFSRAGRGWGAELEYLLPNNSGQDATTGNERVEALVHMINDIHKTLVAA